MSRTVSQTLKRFNFWRVSRSDVKVLSSFKGLDATQFGQYIDIIENLLVFPPPPALGRKRKGGATPLLRREILTRDCKANCSAGQKDCESKTNCKPLSHAEQVGGFCRLVCRGEEKSS